MIERGIEQGEFRDIDAVATAITLTALFEGLALLFFVDPDAEDAALRARLEAFFRGVRFRPADERERET